VVIEVRGDWGVSGHNFNLALEEAIIHDELTRQAKWTEAIAVGDRA